MCDQSQTDGFFPVCDCTEFLLNLSLKIPHPGRSVHTPVSQDLLSALSPLLSALVLREPKTEPSLIAHPMEFLQGLAELTQGENCMAERECSGHRTSNHHLPYHHPDEVQKGLDIHSRA